MIWKNENGTKSTARSHVQAPQTDVKDINNENFALLVDKPKDSKESFAKMKYTEAFYVIVDNCNTHKFYGFREKIISTGKYNRQNTLHDVLFIPEIESNLLSVSRATKNGCQVTFEKKNECDITY